MPEVVFVPDQAPEAVHDVAYVDDHVIVDAPPLVTDEGEAEIVTVGFFLPTPKCEALVVVNVHVPFVIVHVVTLSPVVFHGPSFPFSLLNRSRVSPA